MLGPPGSEDDPGGGTNGPWCIGVWSHPRGQSQSSSGGLGAIPGLILDTCVRGALGIGRRHGGRCRGRHRASEGDAGDLEVMPGI